MTRCTNPILSMLLGSMLMLAQACDQSPAGEEIAARPDPGQNAAKVEVKKDEPATVPSVDTAHGSGDDAPIPPPPPSGRPGDEIPNNGPGYGGGSQGALEPVKTGGEDEDDEDNDFGVCGNGIQEVLRNTNKNCPHLLYGTTIAGNNQSNLVYFNAGTGQGFNIATITNINSVDAIDFSPEGDLYGVGVAVGGTFNGLSVFAQIDCTTGVATIIGPTGIENLIGPSESITDIDFDSDAQLWGFLADQQYAGTINVATGVFTPVSASPIGGNTSLNNGLATFPFPNDQLYTAADLALVLINETDGSGSTVNSLSFPASLTNPSINDMDNDPLENVMYVSITSNGQNNLGILDISNGDVSLIGTTPFTAPSGLDGLAVNRHYEECDTQSVIPVAPGTECINCDLIEIDCADGIDNDFNGLTDCADPNCLGQSCNDGDTCTQNDVCTSVAADGCVGTSQVCNDLNPCTVDTCCGQNTNSSGADYCRGTITNPGTCVFTNTTDRAQLALGGCEVDGQACTVGKCTLPAVTNPVTPNPTFICFETPRQLLTGPLGCLDDNQCTADSCVESWTEEGHLSNGNVNTAAVPWGSTANRDAIGNVILDNDWQCENEVMALSLCFDEDTCRNGNCTITGTGMPGSPSDIECIPAPPVACTTCGSNTDCPTPQTCLNGICTVGGNPPCEPVLQSCINSICVDAICPDIGDNDCVEQACSPTPGVGCIANNVASGTSCDNGDKCLLDATCNGSGTCTGGTVTTCTPPTSPCQMASCDPTTGNCVTTNRPNLTFAPGCEGTNICFDGNCVPAASIGRSIFVTSTISNGNFGGLAGADAICQARAAAGSLPAGTYKAWLSDSTTSANSRLTHSTVPYVRTDGQIVAVDYDQLISTGLVAPTLQNPINIDEFGARQNGQVWTGTNADGTSAVIFGRDANCADWTIADFRTGGDIGHSFRVTSDWTILLTGGQACGIVGPRLYCLQQ